MINTHEFSDVSELKARLQYRIHLASAPLCPETTIWRDECMLSEGCAETSSLWRQSIFNSHFVVQDSTSTTLPVLCCSKWAAGGTTKYWFLSLLRNPDKSQSPCFQWFGPRLKHPMCLMAIPFWWLSCCATNCIKWKILFDGCPFIHSPMLRDPVIWYKMTLTPVGARLLWGGD